jgi:tetratricopeptide (TPR) repeat protein
MDTDRNLLFAVLALQAGLLDRDRFIEGCALWVTRKDVPIGELLVERGWLTADARAVVEPLLELQLRRRDGAGGASLGDTDVQQSAAALPCPAPVDPNMTVAPSEPEGVGRTIFYEEIGRGGMGRVLRGQDTELRRELAVKVLREEYGGNADVVRRFIEEAQIGGQLQHPGIVPVYDLGRFTDRRPYFTMKLVKGRSLNDLLRERPDPRHEQAHFLTVFEQVSQTVAYAHSKRVIHRDLKPQNVMVGAFGEVQVMDWGLAKVLAGQETEVPYATRYGTRIQTERSGSAEDGCTGVVGTPAFMAPEQARGGAEPVDERADVFGLGGILCVILTGRPPFADAAPDGVLTKAAAGDVAEAVARLDRCGADADLVALCKECLSPDAAQRPRDAGEVAARMGAYAAAVQERLRRADLERAAAQARAEEAKATAAADRKARRRTRALAAALLALVVAGAGGGLLVQHQAAEREADRTRHDAEQRQAVEFALEKAAGLRQRTRWGEAAAVLEQAGQVLGGGGPDDLRERLDRAETELALVNRLDAIRQHSETLVDGKFDHPAAERDYAAAFREAGLGQVGDDEAAVAGRVRDSAVSGQLVAALDDWARVAKKPEAKSWLLGVARRADPDPWRDRLRDPAVRGDRRALLALADEVLRDDGAKVEELSPQWLASLGELLGGKAEAVPLLRAAQHRYPGDFWLNLKLSVALRGAKQEVEALSYSRVAVALRPDAAGAHNTLGNALRANGDVDGAVAEFRKAIELDPKFALPHHNLGNALRAGGDVDEAITEFRKAIELDPRYSHPHHNLGLALREKGDVDGAIAEFRKAIELDPENAHVHIALGSALREKKDPDGAIAEFRKATELDPGNAQAHNTLGNALRPRGDVDGAITEFRKAIELDPKFAMPHNNLGLALFDKKDAEGAIAEFRKATELDPKLAVAHNNLGAALFARKDLDGAIAEYRKAIDIDPLYATAHTNLGNGLRDKKDLDGAIAEYKKAIDGDPRLRALDEKLPAVMKGEVAPSGAAEWLALGQLCRQYKLRHLAAVRCYAAAFAADPKLAADSRSRDRYSAACSAALAAAGQATDAKNLPDKVRLMLRRQALTWLRADLAQCEQMSREKKVAAQQLVGQRLAHWQKDADLAPVRDRAALAALPFDERQQWRQLWDDVAALLKKVEEKK